MNTECQERRKAARDMLAALKDALPFVCDGGMALSHTDRMIRLAKQRAIQAVIAQAEAAGVES